MLKFRLPNQIIASTIKEATGVALIKLVIGCKSALTMPIFAEISAVTSPKTSAPKKPKVILKNEKAIDLQKLADTTKTPKVSSVFQGEAMIKSESIKRAKAPQIIIQKAIADIFTSDLLLNKVEAFIGELSSYRLGIKSVQN